MIKVHNLSCPGGNLPLAINCFFTENIFLFCQFHQRQLSILNEYVTMIQLHIPLAHRLFPEMKRLVRQICCSFMRLEKMNLLTKETVLNNSNLISPEKFFEDKMLPLQLSEYG